MLFRLGAGATAVLLNLFFDPCAVAQNRLDLGVNIENPQWKSESDRLETLSSLRQNHIRLIRFPYAPSSGSDYSPINRFLKIAYSYGIQSLIIVDPQYPIDAKKRPAVENTVAKWAQFRLSDADPLLSRRMFDELFAILDREEITLAGIEFGNELNWTQFNGDFPMPGSGRVLKLGHFEDDSEVDQVTKGFDKYLQIFRELRSARDASTWNKHTPLVLAGLVETKSGWIDPKERADAADLDATITYLREQGLDSLADAYAVHSYAGADGNVDASWKIYRALFSQCRSSRKPCWLTEWGANLASKTCPINDSIRAKTVATLLEQQNVHFLAGYLQKSFYYGWLSPNTSFSLYACGSITAAGKEITKWSR